MNDIKRWSIAELRYAGGAEHDVKYVSEVDYDTAYAGRLLYQRKALAAEDRYQRDVLGLNNEGDPIGGEPAGGYKNDVARLTAELEAVRASFDELASLVGFSEDRLKQTGDSPMDCARQLTGRTGGSGDFDQSALAAVLQAELDLPERPTIVAVPRHVPSDLIACIHLEWDGRADSLWPLLLQRISEKDPYP